MRLWWTIGGTILVIFSIISYFYAPSFLSQTAHSFVASITGGNSLSSVTMLHQMGYPHLSVIISASQYLLIGLTLAGIGFVGFGLVAKKVSKPVILKVVADQSSDESGSHQKNTEMKNTETVQDGKQVSSEMVKDVLTKLETQLKDIKTGYENHRQTIEDEKKNLEQKERERMAKIITTGEVLIKEITPDRFEERVKHYIDLKNDETGHPIDLSLLAEKFEKMKETLGSKGKSDLTQNEYDSFRRFLD
ncbi:MAG: hypothetical protein KGH88_01115 [Thaumarchaeota archaeon]|nr:hypothetical protein [Nitrososphaerota archaeon]